MLLAMPKPEVPGDRPLAVAALRATVLIAPSPGAGPVCDVQSARAQLMVRGGTPRGDMIVRMVPVPLSGHSSLPVARFTLRYQGRKIMNGPNSG